MQYRIVHELPGRLRVHCRNLRLDPGARVELSRWVSRHSQVISASLSTRTGNLLLAYSKEASRESVLLLLDDLHLFGVAIIGREGAGGDADLASVAMGACLSTTARGLIRSAIPRPLQRALSGWRLAVTVLRLMDRLDRKQFIGFLYGLAKAVVIGLFAGAFPARLVLSVAFSVTEHVVPALAPVMEPNPRAVDAVALDFEGAQAAV